MFEIGQKNVGVCKLKIMKHDIPAGNHMEPNNASIGRSLVFMVQDFKTQVVVDIILVILELAIFHSNQIRYPINILTNSCLTCET